MGIRYAAELSLSSANHLLKLADDSYQQFNSSDELYGIKLSELQGGEPLGSSSLTDTLMTVYTVAYANTVFNDRWPTQWGMSEVFSVLRAHRFVPPPEEGYIESFYLATHCVSSRHCQPLP